MNRIVTVEKGICNNPRMHGHMTIPRNCNSAGYRTEKKTTKMKNHRRTDTHPQTAVEQWEKIMHMAHNDYYFSCSVLHIPKVFAGTGPLFGCCCLFQSTHSNTCINYNNKLRLNEGMWKGWWTDWIEEQKKQRKKLCCGRFYICGRISLAGAGGKFDCFPKNPDDEDGK